ncbi:MAG: YicC family protein [Acidobacteriota bacterium]|nr:YicC family protein [Acidobacteriota bacterium]MDE2922143.1 YicC family protein [Acidobacteriota bacterium]MDE3265808.1 YicC family protein [Acidobacteriota bacterium]
MTGYGEATATDRRHRVTVTARSVNHRNLDVALRVRGPFRILEPELRAAVAAEVRRGRVEIGIEIDSAWAAAGLDETDAAAERLLETVRRWRRRGIVSTELSAGELLSVARAVRSESRAGAAGQQERALVLETCRLAIASLVLERQREGQLLADSLMGHLASLRACVGVLAARRSEVVGEAAGELERRIGELLEVVEPLDPGRLVQEVALLVERSDTSEELERLAGHLEGFEAAMKEGGAVGRRLVFLSQEILRELNTVGSKCRDLGMQRGVVEGKVLCEQLREQAQNVE